MLLVFMYCMIPSIMFLRPLAIKWSILKLVVSVSVQTCGSGVGICVAVDRHQS